MNDDIERNLGEQPLAHIMRDHALCVGDVVEAADTQMTRKMVTRAVKGRRLTVKAQLKVLSAVNRATGKTFLREELFNY